jgi:heptaprenyl diphosphate synthase
MAFQIVDDVLDVTATEAELGKPAGHDLVEGVYTLPVLRALADGDELRKQLGKPVEGAELDAALSTVRADGAITGALETAREYAAVAIKALDGFRDNEGAAWLHGAVDQLFARVERSSASLSDR